MESPNTVPTCTTVEDLIEIGAKLLFRGNRFEISDFHLEKVLGHGKFGKVWFAREKKMGFAVAIKVIDRKVIEEAELNQQVCHELVVHSQMSHPNIIKFLTFFHEKDHIYLVHEFAEYGSLFTIMQDQKYKRFEEQVAAKYAKQTAEGLMYIHSKRYCHGDIKPENILLDSHKNVKLSDFGLSWPYATCFRDRGFCGTVEYLPPELLSHDYYDFTIDHWSLGVLFYELLAGKSPFHHAKKDVTKRKIMHLDYKFPKSIKEDARDLISKLLRKEPKERLCLDYVITHHWIERCYAEYEI